MIKWSILGLVTLSLAVANAASSYKVVFKKDVVVNGSTVKAGEYKVEVNESTATLKQGKTVVSSAVKVEENATKFDQTSLKLHDNDLDEIRIGGTKTRLVFESATTAAK